MKEKRREVTIRKSRRKGELFFQEKKNHIRYIRGETTQIY
jgi:hypothetical protein